MSLDVLITAGSRRVPLVRAFQRALRATGGGRVAVADVNPLSPTVYVADRSYAVPFFTDSEYIDAILDLCQREHLELVVPTVDDELTLFADHADRFADAGVRVVVSPIETTMICNDKLATCRMLRAHGIEAAHTWLPSELPTDPSCPLFIKPRRGRGGVGAFPVRNLRELEFFLDYVPDPIVQTYLHGPEFTIDLLCGFDGEPLAIVPRERVVIRSGVIDRGRTVRDPRLMDVALRCARALAFVGAINIQCRVVDGIPIVFEINARFSGGIPLTIAAGADFPRAIVDMALGREVQASIGRFQEELWMSSYETSVFVAGASIGFSSMPARRSIPEVA